MLNNRCRNFPTKFMYQFPQPLKYVAGVSIAAKHDAFVFVVCNTF